MPKPSVPQSQADALWGALTLAQKEALLADARDAQKIRAAAADSKLSMEAITKRSLIHTLISRCEPLTIGSSQYADAHPGDGFDIVVDHGPTGNPTIPGLAVAWIPVPLWKLGIPRKYKTRDGETRTNVECGKISIRQSYATAPFYSPDGTLLAPPLASRLPEAHPARLLPIKEYSLTAYASISINPESPEEIHKTLGALELHEARATYDASDDPHTYAEPAFSSIPKPRSPGSIEVSTS